MTFKQRLQIMTHRLYTYGWIYCCMNKYLSINLEPIIQNFKKWYKQIIDNFRCNQLERIWNTCDFINMMIFENFMVLKSINSFLQGNFIKAHSLKFLMKDKCHLLNVRKSQIIVLEINLFKLIMNVHKNYGWMINLLFHIGKVSIIYIMHFWEYKELIRLFMYILLWNPMCKCLYTY